LRAESDNCAKMEVARKLNEMNTIAPSDTADKHLRAWDYEFSADDAINVARRLIAKLRARKIVVNPSSRLMKYLQHVEKFRTPEDRRNWSCDDFHRMVVATQELFLLDYIFDGLTIDPEPTGWSDKFKEILTGDYFPGRGNDSPRDIQAELLFAARAKRHGYRVELCEPDVLILDGANPIAVAAKRPRSMETFQKTDENIRKNAEAAVDQIARHQQHGLIFFDLSLATGIAYKYYSVASDAERERTERQLNESIFGLLHLARFAVEHAIEGKRILGISAFVAATLHTPQLTGAVRFWPNLPLQDRGFRFFSEFRRRSLLLERARVATPGFQQPVLMMVGNMISDGRVEPWPVVLWRPD
jgi:hypothetical protein